MLDAIADALRPETAATASPAALAVAASRGACRLAPHLELISARLAEMEHRPLRLMISSPPRHGKSVMNSARSRFLRASEHSDRGFDRFFPHVSEAEIGNEAQSSWRDEAPLHFLHDGDHVER